METTMDKPFENTLLKAGDLNKNLVVVDADLSRVCETNLFASKYPERYINIGVAEANMVSISAGLALSGKTVFCGTFADSSHCEPVTRFRWAWLICRPM